MKHLLTPCVCFLLLLGTAVHAQEAAKAKGKDNKTKVKSAAMNKRPAAAGIKGAYTMISQKVSVDNRDSVLDVQQLKIYTDRHYMWAHALPGDSLAEFGIGTYRMQGGSVVEYPLYTSMGGEVRDTIDLSIRQRADGYSQVIHFPADNQGREWILTEDYRAAGSNVTTPLDGAWKMVSLTTYSKEGNATEVNDLVQYKVFQSGHVMWGNTSWDSATQRPRSMFGYGTFRMNGPNQAVETMTNSTYRTALVGNPITLQLEFKGRDRYQQTISWPDGTRTVEVYNLMKE